MRYFEGNVRQQLRLLYLGSAVVALLNGGITAALRLPILPIFYILSALLFFVLSRKVTLRRFLPAFILSFLTVVLQSFFTVYVLGDDCGIQLYLLALLIPSYYIRMTHYSPAFQRGFIVTVCAACIVGYLISDEIIDHYIDPITQIDNLSELIFTFINVLGSLSLLAFVGSIFAQGYQRGIRELLRSNSKLEHEVERDALTGLKNRRGIEPVLQKYYQAWQSGKAPLTVALGDIDYFKQINDTYGHDAGDAVLRRLGELFQQKLSTKAQVCRWGGEEFLFVLPLGKEESQKQLEELRREVEGLELCVQGKTIPITMTFGLASGEEAEGVSNLIRLADQRLYTGKWAGRNRVVEI